MATLTIEDAPVTGLDSVTFVAATLAGDEAPTDVGTALLVRNGSAGTLGVLVATPGTVRGLSIEDPQIDVPAGEVGVIPLIRAVFGSLAQITYPGGVTSLEVAVVRLAR